MKILKYIISIWLFYFVPAKIVLCQPCVIPSYAPSDIKSSMELLREETRKILQNARITDEFPHIGFIESALSEEQEERVIKQKVNLHLCMIYDNAMRERLLQLLKNEYRQDEIDTLINRIILSNKIVYENEALKACRFDTMRIFKKLYKELISNKKDSDMVKYNNYEYAVFKFLKLDTVVAFKKTFNIISNEEKKRYEKEFKEDAKNRFIPWVADLCGYVGDKRFVQPLIACLSKSNEEYEKVKVKEALARMKVEPYYSNLLDKISLTQKEIEEGKVGDYYVLYITIRSQKSFLELSKYLKSNKPFMVFSEGPPRNPGDEIKYEVLEILYHNIDNEDMKKYVANGKETISVTFNPTRKNQAMVERMYNWMQKNYGKYKISWYVR